MSTFDEKLLCKKKIIVTGGSSGIGFHTAIELSKLGAEIVLVCRKKEKIMQNIDNFKDFSKVLIIEADLSKQDSGAIILKSLPTEWLPLDGIFHSAGSFLLKPFALSNESDFEVLSSVSLNTLFSFARLLNKKKFFNEYSSIVSMSSVASEFGTPGLGYYSAVKSAVNASCKTMAIEFSKRRIRVNSLISGAIETEMHSKILSQMSELAKEEYKNKHLLGFGNKNDISSMVCFLMSDASRWITGSLIHVDGGYSAFK